MFASSYMMGPEGIQASHDKSGMYYSNPFLGHWWMFTLIITHNPRLFITLLYCESIELQGKYFPKMVNYCTLKEFSLCDCQKEGSYNNTKSTILRFFYTLPPQRPLEYLSPLCVSSKKPHPQVDTKQWPSAARDLWVLMLWPMSLLTGGCLHHTHFHILP